MSTQKANRTLILLLSLALIVLAGLIVFQVTKDGRGRPSSGHQAEIQDVSLRLKWILYSGWAGEILALERGFWEEEGLEVRMEPGGFELDPIRLVVSGEDDIGVAGADQILLARERALPLVAFAVQYQELPVGFAVKADSGIRNIQDFVGRKIGVKYGTDVEPVYRALLARAGLSSDQVEEVPVKFDLTPFYEDLIDVYPGYVTSDLLLPEEQGFDVDILEARDFGVTGYGNVYFTTEEYLSANTSTLVGFLRGVSRGWSEAFELQPSSVAELALSFNDALDLKHQTRVAASLQPYVLGDNTRFGAMDEQGWRQLYEMLRDQGVLQGDVDYTSAYSPAILEITDKDNTLQ